MVVLVGTLPYLAWLGARVFYIMFIFTLYKVHALCFALCFILSCLFIYLIPYLTLVLLPCVKAE